jgi:hypothetical protein
MFQMQPAEHHRAHHPNNSRYSLSAFEFCILNSARCILNC